MQAHGRARSNRMCESSVAPASFLTLARLARETCENAIDRLPPHHFVIAEKFGRLRHSMIKRILEKVPSLMFLAVCACLAASVAAMLLGILRTIKLFMLLRVALQNGSLAVASLVEVADIYLIAASLIIVGLSLCELFVTELNLPDWLVVKSFDRLKSKLFNVIVLVTAVSFLKLLLDTAETALDTLYYGIACAAVIAALGVFARLSGGH
jgi:uncharacterized membrane protein YqhA